MRYDKVTNIELLKKLMWGESIIWNRTDYDNATANEAGIIEQWENSVNRAHPDMPAMILATIYQPERRIDGETIKANFEMVAFWFADDGTRVERPTAQLETLAKEVDNA